MRVAVAGGTGVLGRHVVQQLQERGHDAVVLARSRGVDVKSGEGLRTAMAGVNVVIDACSVVTTSGKKSVEFFSATTQNLLTVGAEVGVRHHVAVSIVGIDNVDYGYYLGKRAQEAAIIAGSLPHTILRATQFHEFPGQMLKTVPGPIALIPRMKTQPVAAREVATMLVDIALGEPKGCAADLAGPQVHDLVDLARRYLRARNSRRPVLGIRFPGAVGTAIINGAVLPDAGAVLGKQTFDEWLKELS